MKSRFLALALSALMLLISVVPALAVEGTGTIKINPGVLSVAPQTIVFAAKDLDGKLMSSTGTTSAWVATDPTGSGAGWYVTVQATDFTATDGKVIPATGLQMQLLDANIAKADLTSNDVPASSMTTFTAINTVKTFAAAAVDKGMGTYNLTPTFTLAIPASTKLGDYTATVTVQIVAGPS